MQYDQSFKFFEKCYTLLLEIGKRAKLYKFGIHFISSLFGERGSNFIFFTFFSNLIHLIRPLSIKTFFTSCWDPSLLCTPSTCNNIYGGNTTCIFRKRVLTKYAFLIVLNFPNLQPPLNYFELPLPSEEYSYISVLFKRVRNMIFDIHWSIYTKHFPCNFTHHYFNEWY